MKNTKKMILLVVFFILLQAISSKNVSNLASYEYAVDFSQPVTLKQVNCLLENFYSLLVLRGYSLQYNGFFDQNVCGNMQLADQVGITYEVYLEITPKSSKSVEEQFNEFYKGFSSCSASVDRFWITITTGGSWSRDYNSNLVFIAKLRQLIKASFPNSSIGIKTNDAAWKKITNDWTQPSAEQDSLWYSNYSIIPSLTFVDYQEFGGWEVPDLKQYELERDVCSIVVNKDSVLI